MALQMSSQFSNLSTNENTTTPVYPVGSGYSMPSVPTGSTTQGAYSSNPPPAPQQAETSGVPPWVSGIPLYSQPSAPAPTPMSSSNQPYSMHPPPKGPQENAMPHQPYPGAPSVPPQDTPGIVRTGSSGGANSAGVYGALPAHGQSYVAPSNGSSTVQYSYGGAPYSSSTTSHSPQVFPSAVPGQQYPQLSTGNDTVQKVLMVLLVIV